MDDVASAESPPTFGSWDEYWAVRHDPVLWLPLVRRALREAGLPDSGPVTMLVPSQYPTACASAVGAVVTIYPEGWGDVAYELEVEAHGILDRHSLPIPRLLAHGETTSVRPQSGWSWLIENVAVGTPWTRLTDSLSMKQIAAFGLGATLRQLHDVPHDNGRILGAGWASFHDLVGDELANLGTNDNRLESIPRSFRTALRDLAAYTFSGLETDTPTSLLHGDVHGDNVFVDPRTGELTALIDLNEMRPGVCWYDLADATFRLLHGEPLLVRSLLEGYGVTLDAPEETALLLLGWGLLHDFDVLTPVVRDRGLPTSDIHDLARHLTGLSLR